MPSIITISVFLDAGFSFDSWDFASIFVVLVKMGGIKLPVFATGNRGFACLGCKVLFFLATVFLQIFQSGCKHSLIQSHLCIPNHGYCLKWMQACFCEVFFRMSNPLPRAVHQLWVACVLPCPWRAGRGHPAFAPNAHDLCMDCQYTGHTSAYDRTRGMTITVESFVLMIPMVQCQGIPNCLYHGKPMVILSVTMWLYSNHLQLDESCCRKGT